LLKNAFGIVGVLFLAYYGFNKLKEAFKSTKMEDGPHLTPSSTKQIILMTLGFSLLNPHVYLDTFILIGGYSAKFPEILKRIQFGAGAACLSALWFYGLVSFASSMSALLNNPKSMRVISFISGIILIALSLKLGSDVHSWIFP
jgi:L-lysine exporter family protein LysE/ArgO